MLKHLPKGTLKTSIMDGHDRRSRNMENLNLRKDNNITQRLARFTNLTNETNVYRIPLRFLCNIGLVNFPVKLDMKIICTLVTNMNKLFESAKKLLFQRLQM